MQLRELSVKRPYLFSLLLVLAFSAVSVGFAGFQAALPELPQQLIEILTEMVLAVLAVILLTTSHSWQSTGFRTLSSPKDLRLYWVLVFPLFPVLVSVVNAVSRMRASEVAFYLILACLVGFAEEAFFRGLMLRSLAVLGLWRAAIISSGVFGLMHLQNLLLGADLAGTLLQVLYAAAVGFSYAAVALRTGAIWPLIIIHALIDFAAFVTSSEAEGIELSTTDVVVNAAYILVFIVYGLLVMRSAKRFQND